MNKIFLYVFFFCIFQLSIRAEEDPVVLDPVIVTATRTLTEMDKIGKSTDLVTLQDIENYKPFSFAETIQDVSGLRVETQGGPGAITTVRMRGARSFDSQLLINGLPVRDAADPQGSSNPFWSYLDTYNLEQVEIVKGANGVLYGSDAAGGSVHIITARGQKGVPQSKLFFEAGSLETFREYVDVSGGIERLDYFASFSRLDTDGIDDNDDYNNTSGYLRLDGQITEKLESGFWFLGRGGEQDLNESPVLVNNQLITDQDDPNDQRQDQFLHYGTYVSHEVTDNLTQNLRLGVVDSDREFLIIRDSDGSDFESDSEFNGNTFNLDWQWDYYWSDWQIWTWGYEYEFEKMEQITSDLGMQVLEEFDQDEHNGYIQDQILLWEDRLIFTLGGRAIGHETAGTDLNGEGSLAYWIIQPLKLHSHIASGFRNPSLYELFGASTFGGTRFVFGNAELEPEESISLDAGVTYDVLPKIVQVDITYFRNDYNELIVFKDSSYVNVDGGFSQGAELTTNVSPLDNLVFNFSYTYTEGEEDSGTDLEGIPQHTLGAGVQWDICPKLHYNANLSFRGDEVIDIFATEPVFQIVRVENDSYAKLDMGFSYDLCESSSLHIRGENILDQDYLEGGFQSPGYMIFGGITIRFP